MIVDYYCFSGIAEERQTRYAEVWNVLVGLSQAVEAIYAYGRPLFNCWLGPLPVSENLFRVADPNVQSHTVIYKQIVRRATMTPYEFKFDDPTHIITGIACVPQDDKTSSPEAEIVDGGINRHHVVIRLSPVEKGRWACSIEISGIENGQRTKDVV